MQHRLQKCLSWPLPILGIELTYKPANIIIGNIGASAEQPPGHSEVRDSFDIEHQQAINHMQPPL